MVVEVRPEDIPSKYGDDELKVMRFQEALEHECFRQAGESQRAGAQRMKDFVNHKDSQLIPPSSYTPGLQPSRLDKWLPQFVAKRLAKGFEVFGRQAKGFLTNDAILIGVETRTSSPVRIPRDEVTMNHITIKTLRYYEELSLLLPAHIDKDNGYRFYTMDQMAILHQISALKQIGMTLEDIKIIQSLDAPHLYLLKKG